jgi:hypothetical protein
VSMECKITTVDLFCKNIIYINWVLSHHTMEDLPVADGSCLYIQQVVADSR